MIYLPCCARQLHCRY